MNTFGAQLIAGHGVRFRLWAPAAKAVELRIQGREPLAMPANDEGWYCLDVENAGAGDLYSFVVDGKTTVPDPASHFNPEGPHGPSMVIDHSAYHWSDAALAWKGRPWHESIIYEVHVGTFTPEGTYASASKRLPELAEMGITVLQLMPIGEFAGHHGWGYDGVLPYAPHAAYGTPDELRHFICEAHSLGMAVMLDVVYNHFGPDGNYLGVYAPQFFSSKHKTAWGDGINFDGEGSAPVRDFFVQSALHWVRAYRIDGFRFDAVHAMLDDSTPDIMQTIAGAIRTEVRRTEGRHFYLVLENDSNDATRLNGTDVGADGGFDSDGANAPRSPNIPGDPGQSANSNGAASDVIVFDGQWNGDFHHPVHVVLTGECDGYYAEYTEQTLDQLGRVLTHGFSRQGGPDGWPGTRPRTPADSTISLLSSVNFLQNHDHVGNRAFGERLIELCETEPLRLAVAMYLLSPPPPLLFMGEEWGATTPFLYFTHCSEELGPLITEGRRNEFARFPRFTDPEVRAQIPDPCAEASFHQSKLDWRASGLASSRRWKAFYTELLATRKRDLQPRLPRLRTGAHDFEVIEEKALRVRWTFRPAENATVDARAEQRQEEVLEMVVNLSADPITVPRSKRHRAGLMQLIGKVDIDADGDVFAPWAGRWQWTAAE